MTETMRAQPARSFNSSPVAGPQVAAIPSDPLVIPVNPEFILPRFTRTESTLEETRSLLFQHADQTLRNLKSGTATARKGYKDSLEVLRQIQENVQRQEDVLRQSRENLQRQEDVLNQAVVAYTYFRISLEDEALTRGTDTLSLNPSGSITKMVYRSKWPSIIAALPRQPCDDPGLSHNDPSLSHDDPSLNDDDPGLSPSGSPYPASTEAGDILPANEPIYHDTSKEMVDNVEVFAEGSSSA